VVSSKCSAPVSRGYRKNGGVHNKVLLFTRRLFPRYLRNSCWHHHTLLSLMLSPSNFASEQDQEHTIPWHHLINCCNFRDGTFKADLFIQRWEKKSRQSSCDRKSLPLVVKILLTSCFGLPKQEGTNLCAWQRYLHGQNDGLKSGSILCPSKYTWQNSAVFYMLCNLCSLEI